MKAVDVADSSREVEVGPVADVVADKAIPTLNHLANISVQISTKDQPPHHLGSDLRLRSTYSLLQDLISILISLANDRPRLRMPNTSLLLVTKTVTSLRPASVHRTMHALATPPTEDRQTMDRVEPRRDINASSMRCEDRNSHVRRSLVSKQHRLFPVSEHRFYLQRHQLQLLDLLSNLRS
jgi:hypothetical protein